MSDIRERHVFGPTINRIGADFGKRFCDYCSRPWPCDAIREADRADKAEAALAVADAASMDDAAAIQELGRGLIAAQERADKAEAALDECQKVALEVVESQAPTDMALAVAIRERDAARADAAAILEDLEHAYESGHDAYHRMQSWADCINTVCVREKRTLARHRAALAAHKEATK